MLLLLATIPAASGSFSVSQLVEQFEKMINPSNATANTTGSYGYPKPEQPLGPDGKRNDDTPQPLGPEGMQNVTQQPLGPGGMQNVTPQPLGPGSMLGDPIPNEMQPEYSNQHEMICASGTKFTFDDPKTSWESCYQTEYLGDYVMGCPVLFPYVCALQGKGSTACASAPQRCPLGRLLQVGGPDAGVRVTDNQNLQTDVPELVFARCDKERLDEHTLECASSSWFGRKSKMTFVEEEPQPLKKCEQNRVTGCPNFLPYVCKDQVQGPACGQTPIDCFGMMAENDCSETHTHYNWFYIYFQLFTRTDIPITVKNELKICALPIPEPTNPQTVRKCAKRNDAGAGFELGVCYTTFGETTIYVYEIPADIGKFSVKQPFEKDLTVVGIQVDGNYRYFPKLSYPYPTEVDPLVVPGKTFTKKIKLPEVSPCPLGADCKMPDLKPLECSAPDSPITDVPNPTTQGPDGPTTTQGTDGTTTTQGPGPTPPCDGCEAYKGTITRMTTSELLKENPERQSNESYYFYKFDNGGQCTTLQNLTVRIKDETNQDFFDMVYIENGCKDGVSGGIFGEPYNIGWNEKGKPTGFASPNATLTGPAPNGEPRLDHLQTIEVLIKAVNTKTDAAGNCKPICPQDQQTAGERRLGLEEEETGSRKLVALDALVNYTYLPKIDQITPPDLTSPPVLVPVGASAAGADLLWLWILIGVLTIIALLLCCFFFVMANKQRKKATPFEEDQLHGTPNGN